MMPFNLALEANYVGRILDFVLALLIVDLGLVLVIGVESKSTFIFRESWHTQHIIECGIPFLAFFQVLLQTSDLGLELIDFLNKVSSNTSTRGSRSFIIRTTRHIN
jgi:hypothetical protein